MGKKRLNFLGHGRILLGALVLGLVRPNTRPSQTCRTSGRPSIVHIRVLTNLTALQWRRISAVTAPSVQHHGIYSALSMM